MFRSFFYAQFDCRFLVGIIPHAHAGKTRCTAIRRRLAGTHPHSRGENMPWPSPAWTQPGSSPLTRGKRALDLPVKVGDGLIPTHAGKTLSSLVAVRARGAHPRSCGENTYQNVTDAATDGSSPLMRGKHRDLAGQQHGRGLIPAHAGKTKNARRPCQGRWAHPRSRRENVA